MKLQPRLAALARRWLEVPSMAEHRRVSGRVVEHSMLFCGLALERTGAAPAEDLDQALAALPRIYGRRVLVEISFVEVEDAPGERHQAIRLQIVG